MSIKDDHDFFKMRQEARTYVSKLFTYGAHDTEPKRSVRMIFEGSDELHLGEIEGAMCLRLNGNVKKTQVTAVITQDDKTVRRLTLQTFKSRASIRMGEWVEAVEAHEFTFRDDEFRRLLRFLEQLKFIDLSNEGNFPIEDISSGAGRRVIIDADDRELVSRLKKLSRQDRARVLDNLQDELSREEINILLGRKRGLQEFEQHLKAADWGEGDWQDFFEREQWVFGYGLDYRIMRHFDREMTVGGFGTDNRNKPTVDFLENFTDYTVLVEIKRPTTDIFKLRSGKAGRSGTWEFSPDFIGAVSQILEQKAEWSAFAQHAEHYSKDGRALDARTRDAKAILVIGLREEFERHASAREAHIRRDTFELFRRDTRGIDIVTFDELLERARFITRNR